VEEWVQVAVFSSRESGRVGTGLEAILRLRVPPGREVRGTGEASTRLWVLRTGLEGRTDGKWQAMVTV